MCGICGYIEKKRSLSDLAGLVSRMTGLIRHRGPDEDGFLIHEGVALGMRRLKVIDLVSGTQPVFNETNDIAVVYNGEIYNFRELRDELMQRGHRFRTQSDTEVIVHAWEEYGVSCVERFNGMFAFCVYDLKKRSLFIVRDRVGIKPLYYVDNQACFAFASELKCLLEIPELSREYDLRALDEYLTFEYTLGPKTVLSSIRKLLPGHYIVMENQRARIEQYWRLGEREPFTDRVSCAGELRKALSLAVKRRLISDVPLGVFLSGGIDSSILIGLMHEHVRGRIKTFSIGFKNRTYNELPYARLIARRYNTEHHESIVDCNLKAFIGDFCAYLDEPMADVSVFPTYLISRQARSMVTVVLSGDGGDELFGGYETYMAQQLYKRYYRRIPRLLRHTLIRGLADRLRPTRKKKGIVNRLKRFVAGDDFPADLMHYRWMLYLHKSRKQALYRGMLEDYAREDTTFEALRSRMAQVKGADELNRMMLSDFSVYLPEDILTKVDRMSMAVSLEARVPYLDHSVVELAYRIPGDWKVEGAATKAILKEACRDLLPEEIRRKPKEGFSIPLKNWLRDELKDTMQSVLTDPSFAKLPFFDHCAVETFMREHVAGSKNHAHMLWTLMVLALWHKRYIG
ncbi:MAG: asparagine synthase (glutamine-hydrolyzing) [Candidatus Omnitrophica bacterium]|nr:asparagine synthase (glutamine-hydrolyzing) [Candidatus Omnitrophota bacterium]